MFRNTNVTRPFGSVRTWLALVASGVLAAMLATTVSDDASEYVAATGSIHSEPYDHQDSGAALDESTVGGSVDEQGGGVGLLDEAFGGSVIAGQTDVGTPVGDQTPDGGAASGGAAVAGSDSPDTSAAPTDPTVGPAPAAEGSADAAAAGGSTTAGGTGSTSTAQPPSSATALPATPAPTAASPPTTIPAPTVAVTPAPAVTTAPAPIAAPTPAPTVPAARAAITGYRSNLDMIRAQPIRNRNHDGSPYRNVPQASLDTGDGSPLLGPRSAYLNNPNGNPEQSFPVPAGGQFRIACEFSHFAYDDPLVAPGRPGGAHLHMFFGNTDVNAYSTYQTLRDSGSSTCNGQELNRTGYWAAAMIDGDGNARIPERVVVYYKAEGVARGRVQPYRPGMANISPTGVGVAEVSGNNGGAAGEVEYKCSDNFSGATFATGTGRIPDCDGSRFGAGSYPAHRVVLEMEIKFWHCFDPSRSDSDIGAWVPAGSGRGHWFYGNCDGSGGGGTGPAYETYPHMTYFVNYVVEPGEDTSDWFLSSDVDPASITGTPRLHATPGGTHHADWWGAWHPDINREFLDNCVNYADGAPSGCGFGYLSNGGPNGNAPSGGRALRYRPQYDRPGDSGTVKVPLESLFAQLCAPLGPSHGYSSPMTGAWCKPS
ncbi:MAG: DUF1996 domain-containing protein [Actinomycetota bacterium]